MKIACFTVAALDFFPQHKQHFAGGNSLNQAIRFRQMGYSSAFIGALGIDAGGDRIAALLQKNGVDTSHTYRRAGQTASNQIVNDEVGERFGVEGAWKNGVYHDFSLSSEDWDYLSSFEVWATHGNCPAYAEALKHKQKTQFLCVDFLHLLDLDHLRENLGLIDIAYIGGTAEMAEGLSLVASECPGVIVLTLGAEGSLAFQGDRIFKQPALPVEKVVDTTGCGDAFQAAFTASYLQNKDIPTALLAGAELGRRATQSLGGVPW